MPLHLHGPSGVVATSVRLATTVWARLRGVIGGRPLGPRDALVIRPCSRVHTFGVRYPIDVVFCDDGMVVLHVQTFRPRSLSPRVDGSVSVIELAGGRAAATGIVVGVELRLEAAS